MNTKLFSPKNEEKLELLASQLAGIISDYEVNIKNGIANDKYHVLKWVNQFPQQYKLDNMLISNFREFILEQTINLLSKSYYSKRDYHEILNKMFIDSIEKNKEIINFISFCQFNKMEIVRKNYSRL